jgi:uncharacterized DUF497 family protein
LRKRTGASADLPAPLRRHLKYNGFGRTIVLFLDRFHTPLTDWYNCYTIISEAKLRVDWDEIKNQETYKKRGFTFEQISRIFENPHFVDQKNDDPEQYFAIGIMMPFFITVVFEYREDEIGEYVWIVTYWKSTRREREMYAEAQK